MLDRVRSRDKEKVQFVLEREMIRDIRKASADEYKTQSKFISDLVSEKLTQMASDRDEYHLYLPQETIVGLQRMVGTDYKQQSQLIVDLVAASLRDR